MFWILFFSLWIFAGINIGQLINLIDKERGQYTVDNRWIMSVGWVYVCLMAILEYFGNQRLQVDQVNQNQSIDPDEEWLREYIEPLVKPIDSNYSALVHPDFVEHLGNHSKSARLIEFGSEAYLEELRNKDFPIWRDPFKYPPLDFHGPFNIGDVANLSGN